LQQKPIKTCEHIALSRQTYYVNIKL